MILPFVDIFLLKQIYIQDNLSIKYFLDWEPQV